MLVLSRKRKEAVRLILPDGREIRVVFCYWQNGQARLGFEAPTDVRIMREELIEEANHKL